MNDFVTNTGVNRVVLMGYPPKEEERQISTDSERFLALLSGAVGKSTARCHPNGAEVQDQSCSREGEEGAERKTSGAVADLIGGETRDRQRGKSNNGAALRAMHGSSKSSTDASCQDRQGQDNLSDRSIKKLVRVLRECSIAGRRSVTLTITTPRAGEIRLDVRIIGKKVFMRAMAEDPRAQAALTLAVDELKQQLRECGLELGGLDIGRRHKDDELADNEDSDVEGSNKTDRDESGREDTELLLLDQESGNGMIHILA